MNQVTLASQAIPLSEEMTLGLVIASGDVTEQRNLSVQIEDTVLNQCEIISHDGQMIVALLPRQQAEKCIDPNVASAVSIAALGIIEAEIDWTSFPSLIQSKQSNQPLEAAPEEEEEQFYTLDEEQPSLSHPTGSFSPVDAVSPAHTDAAHQEEKPSSDATTPTTAAEKKSRTGKKKTILLGSSASVATIILILAGSWYWLHRAPNSTAPTYENMTPADVVKQLNSPAAIGREGWRRIIAGQDDSGLRLLNYAAIRQDPDALQKMGELYDPASFKNGGPVPQPNPKEAARYYHKAIQAGNRHVIPEQTRLLEDLRKKADNGDENAAFTLQEYAR